MTIHSIKLEVQETDLGDEVTSEDLESYIAHMERRLREEFPGAHLSIAEGSGRGYPYVVADYEEEEARVNDTIGSLFQEWLDLMAKNAEA